MSDYTDFYKGLYEDAQKEIARLQERDDDSMKLSMNMNEKLLDEINVLEDKLVSDTTLMKGIYQTYGWVKAQEKKKKGFPPLAIIIHYIQVWFVCKNPWSESHAQIYKNEKDTSLVQEIFTGVMKLLAQECEFTFTYETIPSTLDALREYMKERNSWESFPNLFNIHNCLDDGYIIKASITMKWRTTKRVSKDFNKLAPKYERITAEQIIDWGNEWWVYSHAKCKRTTNLGKLNW